jgi:hypothetical protein
VLGIDVKSIEFELPESVTVAIDSYAAYTLAIVVIEFELALYALSPVVFPDLTVNVYAVAAVNPDNVIGDEPVPVIDPGFDSAVNVVPIPPVFATVYVIVADSAPAVAVPIVGVSGMSTILEVFADASL